MTELSDLREHSTQQQNEWFPSTVTSNFVQPSQITDNNSPEGRLDDQSLSESLRKKRNVKQLVIEGLHTLDPVGQNSPSRKPSPPPDPAILNLANNNDLNVATIARQANKSKLSEDDNEVIIPLR